MSLFNLRRQKTLISALGILFSVIAVFSLSKRAIIDETFNPPLLVSVEKPEVRNFEHRYRAYQIELEITGLPGETAQQGRFQINWSGTENNFIGATLIPFSVTEEKKVYRSDALNEIPKGAKVGLLYLSSHNSKPVQVHSVRLIVRGYQHLVFSRVLLFGFLLVLLIFLGKVVYRWIQTSRIQGGFSQALRKFSSDALIVLFISLLSLALLEVTAKYIFNWQYQKISKQRAQDFNEDLFAAYPGKSKEQIIEIRSSMLVEEIFEPWLNIRMPDIQSPFLNTNGLLRKSAPLEPIVKSPQKAYFFGGSTMFGINVQDDETLPSHFQALYNNQFAGKRSVQVFNYGQPYYISPQESVSFYMLLMKGHRPDIAVFMDGLNDTINKSSTYYRYPAYSDRISKLFQLHQKYPEGASAWQLILGEMNLTRLFALWTRKSSDPYMVQANTVSHGSPRYNASYADPEGITDSDYESAMIKNYFENIGMTKVLCQAFKVKCFFFWQPVPMYNYTNRKYDRICHQAPYPYVENIYVRMKTLMKPEANEFFIADLVNEYKGAPFVDGAHYSSGMNKLIAERMIQIIEGKK